MNEKNETCIEMTEPMQNQEDVLQEQKQADALPAEDVAADTAAAPAEPATEQAEAGKPARRRAGAGACPTEKDHCHRKRHGGGRNAGGSPRQGY